MVAGCPGRGGAGDRGAGGRRGCGAHERAAAPSTGGTAGRAGRLGGRTGRPLAGAGGGGPARRLCPGPRPGARGGPAPGVPLPQLRRGLAPRLHGPGRDPRSAAACGRRAGPGRADRAEHSGARLLVRCCRADDRGDPSGPDRGGAMRRGLGRLLVGLTLLALLGCTQVRNPATGELQYTSLTPEDEKKLGREENPKALAQFGGRYEDATLSAYVEKGGNRGKNASELADQPFTFTVLDSDVVNAFALPGGYVNVPRGLLALTNNEAELAGVRGHEIGHVPARHTAQRYDQAQVGQLGATAAQLAGLLLGGYLGGSQGAQPGGAAAGQIGSLGAQAYVQGYSREQEFQADQLGIRYLGAAGYDPGAMATFLATLQAEDAYQQRTAGGQGEDSPLGDWFRSHPRTPERVARAVEAVNAETPGAHETNRPALLAAIDGMLYG